MAHKKKSLPPKFQAWLDARKRFRLSHDHIQMARELGLNPKKLGSLANHDQERWKSPLPIFIEDLYFKRFGRERPEVLMTIEQMLQKKRTKQQDRAPAKEPSVSKRPPPEEVALLRQASKRGRNRAHPPPDVSRSLLGISRSA